MNTTSISRRISKYLMTTLRVFAVMASLLFVISLPAMAETAAPAGTEEAAKPAPKKKSVWDMIVQGGPIMYPIVACSLFTFYLVIDMYMRTATNKLCPPAEISKAQQLFQAGDYVNCYQVLKATPCAFNNCVKYALSFVGKGKEQTEEALLVEIDRENNRLQNRVNYLSVIGVCTPMIGLLGTVFGMMGAFDSLGKEGAAGGGDGTSELAHHIGEVLVATASGLLIAIPAFMFFYILKNRLAAKMHELEDQAQSLFRNMPYDHFHGLEIGEELTYAAIPNWVEHDAAAAQG